MVDSSILCRDNKFLDIYEDKLILRHSESKEIIQIQMSPFSIQKLHKDTQNFSQKLKSVGVKAIYGIIELLESSYLMIITKSNYLGQIHQKKIFQMETVEFFSTKKTSGQDDKYIKMLQNIFNTKYFYFSDEYDLTNSFQKFCLNQFDMISTQSQFFYNELYMTHFIRLGAQEWITPIISGYVSINYTCIQPKNTHCEMIIVSRRDKSRVGLRFVSRGADLDGNVSNFAENEQIIVISHENSTEIYSYVQTRGSMPFLWKSPPNIKWVPKVSISEDYKLQQDVLKKHFTSQIQQNGKQTLINLIDKKKQEKTLGEYYGRQVNQLKDQNIRYVWFDFHSECKKMKYENLRKLIDQCKEDIQNQKYFKMSYIKSKPKNIKIESRQTGVFRTNCMDCLDRTNVVQSVISRNVIHQIMYQAQVLPKSSGSAFEKFPDEMEQQFRDSWTENADVMSKLYTGTGALKTDFTKTGKRTTKGAIKDGINSLTRYFQNNFYDGHRQNCFDLLTGKLVPSVTPYKQPKVNSVYVMIIALLLLPLLTDRLLQRANPYINQYISYDYGSNTHSDRILFFICYIIHAMLFMKNILPCNICLSLSVFQSVLLQRPVKEQQFN